MPSETNEFADSRVLIIDDNPGNRRLFLAMLEAMGVGHVLEANDGTDGLEKMESFNPGLVILDLMMPRLDGFGFLAAIRERPDRAQLPVLVTTALSDQDNIIRAFDSGAADYLIKPVDRREFMARVSVHLRTRRLLDDLGRYQERLSRDLEAASRMQQAVLPSAERVAAMEGRYGIRLSSAVRSSDELGGDIWDIIAIDDHSFAVYLADFTGHGVAAAINTFRLHVMMMRKLGRNSAPEVVLERINQRLLATLQRGQFAAMAHAVFDLSESRIRVAVAGAPPPLSISRDGTAEPHAGQSLPLGLVPHAPPAWFELPFPPGGGLMLHSDGLNEAHSPSDQLLGESGVRQLASGSERLEEALVRLGKEGWRFEDDVTAVRILRRW